MKTKVFVLHLILLYCALPLAAGRSALQEYNDSNYREAAAMLKNDISEHGFSPEAYYNLGNASVLSADYSTAVISYIRALRLDPSFSEARQNLEYTLSKVSDTNNMLLKGKQLSVQPEENSFFRSLYLLFAERVSSNCWAWLAFAMFLFAMLSAAAYLFLTDVRIRKAGFFTSVVSLLFTVVFVAFSVSAKNYVESSNLAVAVQYRVNLKANPASDAKDVASTLSAGTLFQVIQSKKDEQGATWYKVRLNRDFIGWIPASDIEII